jgi:hypothetical protein
MQVAHNLMHAQHEQACNSLICKAMILPHGFMQDRHWMRRLTAGNVSISAVSSAFGLRNTVTRPQAQPGRLPKL